MRKLSVLVPLLLSLIQAAPVRAADAAECTITDFASSYDLTGNKLNVQDKITLDCAELPDKTGFSFTLPRAVAKPTTHNVNVALKSITDEKGNKQPYTETKTDQSVSWKIGEDKTKITGAHQYWLTYTLDGVIIDAPNSQRQLSWELLGNSWTMPITKFNARIVWPKEITEYQAAVQVFDGAASSTTNKLSNFQWFDNGDGRRVLVIASNGKMSAGEGINVNILFPASIYNPNTKTPVSRADLWFRWVGVVGFALILVLAAIWYLLRRRRHHHHSTSKNHREFIDATDFPPDFK
jgi:hypothetical protein